MFYNKANAMESSKSDNHKESQLAKQVSQVYPNTRRIHQITLLSKYKVFPSDLIYNKIV